MVEFRNFWHKSVGQSSLEDQDKEQISFFVIRFTAKYSDWLVTTAALKVLDLQFLNVLGSVRLSLRFCKILVLLWHLCSFLDTSESVLHYPQQQCSLSNII